MGPCEMRLCIFLLLFVPLQVEALSGPNVCTRTRATVSYISVCRFRFWLICCSYTSVYRTRYTEEKYCCPGWRNSGNRCSVPICNPPCVNGICEKPGKCRCNRGFYGAICNNEKSCSASKPCFPGICYSENSCICSAEDFSGSDCTTLKTAPVVTLAAAKLAYFSRDMEVYDYNVDATNLETGENSVWVNFKRFNRFTAQLSGYLKLNADLLPQPYYISRYGLGIVNGSLVWRLLKETTDGTDTYESARKEVLCENSLSYLNPVSGLLNCNLEYDNFDRSLDNGDRLTLTFRLTSGGFQTMSTGTRLFRGPTTVNTIMYLVDKEFPNPPNDVHLAFYVVSDITKEPIITKWRGWSDRRSGMDRYNWEVFKMETIGNELRELNSGYLSPYTNEEFNSTDSNSYSNTFTPPEAGIYSLILESSDAANNSIYLRRFFIYDPVSKVTVKTACLKALSGLANTSYTWQTYQPSSDIEVKFGWSGCFTNALHVTKGFLNKIQDYPPQLRNDQIPDSTEFKKIITDITDPKANRTSDAIPNVDAIVSFECGYRVGVSQVEPDVWQTKDLALDHTFSVPGSLQIRDGDFIRLWAKATDIMGNTKDESMLLGFDNTLPQVYDSTYKFLPNTDDKIYRFSSRLIFDVEDEHSGIAEIDFYIIHRETQIYLHNGTIPPNEIDTCSGGKFCYCLRNAKCFSREHVLDINNCWLRLPSTADSKEIDIQLVAKNGAMLSSALFQELKTADQLNGIGVYDGPQNIELVTKFAQGVRLAWNFTEGCYTRTNIKLTYLDPAGEAHEKDISPNATAFDLLNLQPLTTYNVSLIIVYDQGDTSSEVGFQFTTSNERIKTQALEGITGGTIAGIVMVLVMLLAFIVFVLVLHKTGRLQKVQQNVITPIRNSVRRRQSGAVGYKQYNTGGYDEDDIYMYGGITFEQQPDWQYKMDDVELDSIIKVGRFARIYKAKLYKRGKPETVVAKTLKDEFTEEDAILMKAKINFFGTKIGEHSCVLGFVGAITEDSKMGPVMLLEYCELGQLKDWLVEHKSAVNDETVEMIFRFGFDVARGMQFLASKEIIHMRLAARNVFVTGHFEAKIAGFGPRHGDEEDESERKERVPIKWMAPECFNSSKSASEKSDVWSYGITLWEIFSMGVNPYENIRSKELFRWLKRGNRMPKPEYSDDLHYEIMRKCWDKEPGARPSFSEIIQQIESLYRQSSGDFYYEK